MRGLKKSFKRRSSLSTHFLKPKERKVISRLQSESFQPLRQVPALL